MRQPGGGRRGVAGLCSKGALLQQAACLQLVSVVQALATLQQACSTTPGGSAGKLWAEKDRPVAVGTCFV